MRFSCPVLIKPIPGAAFFSALFVGACSSPPDEPEPKPAQPTYQVVMEPRSLELSAPGDARVAVDISRDGDLVAVPDSLTKVIRTTGPFSAAWDPRNARSYRNLDITGTAPGSGSVIVSVGDAADTIQLTATAVSFRTVSATTGFACGVALDERVWCWGDNTSGQLGVTTVGDCNGAVCQYGGGRRNISPLPVPVQERLAGVSASGAICSTSFGAGVCGQACALTAAGIPECWGGGYALAPLSSAGTFKSLEVSPTLPYTISFANCGLGTDDHAYCFSKTAAAPDGVRTEVGAGLQFTAFSSAREHACGVVPNGDIYCWGSNARGNLGSGAIDASPHPTPERAGTTVKFSSVKTGEYATCGLAVDGTIYCWGTGYSAAGVNPPPACPGLTTLCQATPRQLENSGTYTAISMTQTGNTVCGLTATGAVQCWSAYNAAPTTIPVSQPLSSISVGAPDLNQYFRPQGCGVSATHVAWCWNGTAVWKVGL